MMCKASMVSVTYCIAFGRITTLLVTLMLMMMSQVILMMSQLMTTSPIAFLASSCSVMLLPSLGCPLAPELPEEHVPSHRYLKLIVALSLTSTSILMIMTILTPVRRITAFMWLT